MAKHIISDIVLEMVTSGATHIKVGEYSNERVTDYNATGRNTKEHYIQTTNLYISEKYLTRKKTGVIVYDNFRVVKVIRDA